MGAKIILVQITRKRGQMAIGGPGWIWNGIILATLWHCPISIWAWLWRHIDVTKNQLFLTLKSDNFLMNCDLAGMIPDSGQYINWLQGYMGQIPIGNEVGTNFRTQKQVLFFFYICPISVSHRIGTPHNTIYEAMCHGVVQIMLGSVIWLMSSILRYGTFLCPKSGTIVHFPPYLCAHVRYIRYRGITW